jgi:hypothetical protein
MYTGLCTSDTLHKKCCRIGPGLCGTSENTYSTTFVHKGKRKAGATMPGPFNSAYAGTWARSDLIRPRA